MKKVLSAVLALAMCLCILSPAAVAAEKEKVYPIIIVPGYSSSSLFKEGENGEKIHVWGVVIGDIINALVKNALELGIDLASLAAGDAEKLSNTVGREFVRLYGDMAYDTNGKPVTELKNYHKTAAEVNTAYVNEYEDGAYIHEGEIMPYVTQNLGDKAEEWTFNFNTDFRQNSIFCAKDLAVLIKDVINYTGSDKVNILAVSHGGQVSGTYFSLCSIASRGGEEAEKAAGYLGMSVEDFTELFTSTDVHNAVLTVPAIGGALLCYDILTKQVKLDEETLLYFIENGMMFEEDYNWLVKANQLGFLDDVVYYLTPYMMKVLGYWGSIWDFVPCETYEDVKATFETKSFLDTDIIKQSDYFHNEILPHTAENLQQAEKRGTNIYLVAGSGAPSVVGTKENSDAIISLNASTGATVAPFGSRFSDGYLTLGTQCSDPSHNHLSPEMDVDVSTGYLPETTWIVNGLFHGMTYKDDYTKELMKTLVERNEHTDIYTFEEYPQFHCSTNVCQSVYAEFDSSVPGYASDSDTALVITNLSKKSKMRILGVKVDGCDISFKLKDYSTKRLNPQESIAVKFEGNLPKESLKAFRITISYILIGSITPVNEKTYTFTAMNGEKAVFDTLNPYTQVMGISTFRELIKGKPVENIMTKLGLVPFIEVIFDIITSLFGKYISAFTKLGK